MNAVRRVFVVLVCATLAAGLSGACLGQPRVGFIDPGLPKAMRPRSAAAFAFAESAAAPVRLKPGAGAWQDAEGRPRAPEEFDLVWFHQGDDLPAAKLDDATGHDLLQYVQSGGSLLVSGAAGRVLNDLGIEPTPLRILGPTEVAFASGVRVLAKYREHPIFAGLDTARPILLTTRGGNALADFYGTEGPHGELLANGSSAGERPLVEYRVGEGRVIFVGWRLPDFTTARDPHRANLERLFKNLFAYLARENKNRAQMIVLPGKTRYERILGVPFLRTARPIAWKNVPAAKGQSLVALLPKPADGAFPAGDVFVAERAAEGPLPQALAVTVASRERPVTRFVELRRRQQAASDRRDEELMRGLKILRPQVQTVPGPLAPLKETRIDQSVILGHSAFMAPGEGLGDAKAVYEPVEEGGFRIRRGTGKLNRPIVHGQNRVWTGDLPIFRIDTVTGNGSYAKQQRVFPLWPRPDAAEGNVNPSMGSLRIAAVDPSGRRRWLDEIPEVATVFLPGYTEYDLAARPDGWKAKLRIAPLLDSHGFVCRVELDRDVRLAWQYGGVWWQATESNQNRVEIKGPRAAITEANLPNGQVLVGWDGPGDGEAVPAAYGQQAEFVGDTPRRVYHIFGTWGVTRYDAPLAKNTMARLDTPASAAWPRIRDRLKQSWFDCYIGRALDVERRFDRLAAAPERELERTCQWWDERRQEFQIRTPDKHLNALVNWERCISEHHRQGPGLVLGGQIWQMYAHISTGWYGKQWAGDHRAMEECLRFYGAMQAPDGFVRWISPSLVAFAAENNTAYWVDQVWFHYAWTGDRQFVRDLWPQVRAAVACQQRRNDPDGDGLFRDYYEYWNCDSNGKGPKSAAPSAMSWAMLDRAAKMAGVVGDARAEADYRAAAEKTRREIFRQLWREDEGRLGSIGADRLWRGHPQTWEEYLAINAGLLSAEQGRRAMRWIASRYGFEPQPGVHLLSCSDWWPIRWSVQWVPTGDTCLAALAGIRSGDVELWWPYLRTAVLSAFRSEFPGINMGIANTGAGGGDREDVDSVDPYMHVAVRGLFGIEPAVDQGRIDICPALPAAWNEASITTPDVSYQWRRSGDRARLEIRTPRPMVKRVRANLSGPEVVTPAQTQSTVTVALGPQPPAPERVAQPTILWDRREKEASPAPVERQRLVLFDLASACNLTVEELGSTRFIFDYADYAQPLAGWWGNPSMILPPAGRVVEASGGPVFLTSGRPYPGLGAAPKNLLALSSWRPNPLPGGATVPVGLKCRRVWLLLVNYVHPMKNYIPNGEIVLRYAGGRKTIESLVPPLNCDCYFQHFSLAGVAVPFGKLGPWPTGWSPIHRGSAQAHADAQAIACDADCVLESIGLRATCSEGVLGLAAITAETAQ